MEDPAERLALSTGLEEGTGEREPWGHRGRGLPVGRATATETPSWGASSTSEECSGDVLDESR